MAAESALERLWEELAGISGLIASLAEQVTQLQEELTRSRIESAAHGQQGANSPERDCR